ncbi:MAG: hypothetical protein JF887_05140 [Candidatus Dormibacteraeota bacterium]|uniref:Uncharacterized protein n=1 Tax=Candidatus Amunia macphersoniae TaxID=3127014 RepID=A0A934KG00_9BACT|nr:hypothetical protein [Candidatus Dormibacteraeota bacterium]
MSDLPPGAPTPVTTTERTKPTLWVAIGLIAGTLAGLLAGFLIFKHNPNAAPSARATPTPTGYSPTASTSGSPSASATASSAPASSAPASHPPGASAPAPSSPATSPPDATGWNPSGHLSDPSFSGCPAMAPGQHPLAAVSGPSAAGETASPSNDWYGCGNAVTPGDTPGFTGANWEIANSFSCPDSDGPGAPGVPGMNIESWVYAGGGTPIQNDANRVTTDLPWADDAHASVSQGGDYRLRTRLVNNATGDNRCRWHIRAYTTAP